MKQDVQLDLERQYLSVLTQDLMVAYHVNLRENTSMLVKVDRKVNQYEAMQTSLRCVNPYMDRIKLYCAKLVVPNLRAEFLQIMNPDNIRRELKKRFRFVYRYRTLRQDEGHQYYEAQVYRMDDEENIENVLIGFRNIDDVVTQEQRDQIELEERYEREQNQNEVLAALGRSYQAIFRIDLTKDTYERMACREEVSMYYDKNELSAARALMKLCDTAISERFAEHMRQFFDLRTLAARLQSTDVIETECVVKDGNWHRARFIVKRRDKYCKAVSVLYVTQVIDEEKRYQEQLLSRVENADLANRAKTEFISQVAHDIRTPMNVMFGFLEIARANPGDEETVSYALERMYQAGIFLKELISDVLDIAKMESNRMQLKPSEMSLRSFFDEIYDTTVNEQTEKSHNFQFEADFEHDLVMADPVRLKQIYTNLLSNAVKYTPDGGTIDFKASNCELADEDKVRLTVEVRDTGIGMSKEFMDKMFDEYERAVDTRINEVSGYGLGLSIVRRLVELMDGTIDVQSSPGEGTTFTVSLDIPYVKEDDARESAHKIDYTKACAGMHLLVAEDNELNREIISELLHMYGISCECVENGILCLQKMQTSCADTYDAILMDMQMPVMNGIEATRAIRSLPQDWAQNIPIFAMTANAMNEDIDNCLRAGMNAHLSKPIDMKQMIQELLAVKKMGI